MQAIISIILLLALQLWYNSCCSAYLQSNCGSGGCSLLVFCRAEFGWCFLKLFASSNFCASRAIANSSVSKVNSVQPHLHGSCNGLCRFNSARIVGANSANVPNDVNIRQPRTACTNSFICSAGHFASSLPSTTYLQISCRYDFSRTSITLTIANSCPHNFPHFLATSSISSHRTSRSRCAWTCQPRPSFVISVEQHPPRTFAKTFCPAQFS